MPAYNRLGEITKKRHVEGGGERHEGGCGRTQVESSRHRLCMASSPLGLGFVFGGLARFWSGGICFMGFFLHLTEPCFAW
jgi:hypothetical protein